jgi:hypothetical protein
VVAAGPVTAAAAAATAELAAEAAAAAAAPNPRDRRVTAIARRSPGADRAPDFGAVRAAARMTGGKPGPGLASLDWR